MEQISPDDLFLFARVMETGSFSRTAERLKLPKSTVSRRIAQLETRLGERLIVRTTRRLAITDFGRELLAHARQVVAEVDAVQALTDHRQAQPSGRLRVSMPSDFATLLLADMLAAFIVLHPAVTLEIDLSPRRVDLLGEGFDLAIRMGELADDGLLVARRLATFAVSLYAAPGYLADHGEPATPDDLGRHAALCLLGRNGEPEAWTLLGPDQMQWSGPLASRVGANSPELLIALARAGAGIAAVPDTFAAAAVRAGQLRRVLPMWRTPAHTAWVVFPGRRLLPAKTRAFIDMLDAALALRPGV